MRRIRLDDSSLEQSISAGNIVIATESGKAHIARRDAAGAYIISDDMASVDVELSVTVYPNVIVAEASFGKAFAFVTDASEGSKINVMYTPHERRELAESSTYEDALSMELNYSYALNFSSTDSNIIHLTEGDNGALEARVGDRIVTDAGAEMGVIAASSSQLIVSGEIADGELTSPVTIRTTYSIGMTIEVDVRIAESVVPGKQRYAGTFSIPKEYTRMRTMNPWWPLAEHVEGNDDRKSGTIACGSVRIVSDHVTELREGFKLSSRSGQSEDISVIDNTLFPSSGTITIEGNDIAYTGKGVNEHGF